MLDKEIEILTKISENKYSFKQQMSSRMAVVHPYLASSIYSLLKRGYLKACREGTYQLTLKGNRVVRERLKANGGNSNSMKLRGIHKYS